MFRQLTIVLFSWVFCVSASAQDFRGSQFLGLSTFRNFDTDTAEGSLVSPVIHSAIDWDELVLSWNVRGAAKEALLFEARVIYPARSSRWYSLGEWSPGEAGRRSVRGQKDSDGTVDTDTLKLKQSARAFQVRIKRTGGSDFSSLRFLGISLHDSTSVPAPLLPNQHAWGKTLPVPERSQANYPEGISSWCSPTSTSMLLAFWADALHRPDLNYDVPEVARAVNDPNWPGTGNWPFNTAFAGTHEGIRAFVTRLSDVSELEDWIAAGIPVAVSVAYPLLRGEQGTGNGHLVVCIGFTSDGDVIVNDPGRRAVRQTYKRANLVKAWKFSENTVYLIYPENAAVPADRFHHWSMEFLQWEPSGRGNR